MTAGLQVPTPIAKLVKEEQRETEWENEKMEAELVQVAQGKLKEVQKRVMEGFQDEPVAPYQALPVSLKHFASAEPIVEPSERAPEVRIETIRSREEMLVMALWTKCKLTYFVDPVVSRQIRSTMLKLQG